MFKNYFSNSLLFCLFAGPSLLLHAHERTLLVIDAQNGFVDELPVNQATEIVNPINDLVNSNIFNQIITTKDFHPANHKSFKTVEGECSNFSFKWEPHCIENTNGARFIKGLNLSKENSIVSYKGQNPNLEEFSGWNAIIQNGEHQGKTVAEVITNSVAKGKPVEIALTGLATDYCVAETAKDLVSALELINTKKTPVSLYLIQDAVKGVEEKTTDDAINHLKSVGFKLITAQEYIKRAQSEIK